MEGKHDFLSFHPEEDCDFELDQNTTEYWYKIIKVFYLSIAPRKLLSTISSGRRLRNNLVMLFRYCMSPVLLSHEKHWQTLFFDYVYMLLLRKRKLGKIGFVFLGHLSLPISQMSEGGMFRTWKLILFSQQGSM